MTSTANQTDAERCAAFFHNDGQCFRGPGGRTFSWEVRRRGADVEVYRTDPDGGAPYQVPRADMTTADRIRYVFPDGSAIVEHGDGWDLEGDAPGTWRG